VTAESRALSGAPAAATRERLLRFARFALVGVGNTAFSYVVFRLVLRALGDLTGAAGIAYGICYAAGFALSFTLNRSWTFRSTGRARAELVRFLAAQGTCLVLSAGLVSVGVSLLRLPMTPWWVCVTGLTMVANYAMQRRWVFR
jgi:putative flippase GtrA